MTVDTEFVPGLAGVPAARSAISFIDGEVGILEYRGRRIEVLAEKGTFEEIVWLLLYGNLPNADELAGFCKRLDAARQLPDGLVELLRLMPRGAHPMNVLQAAVAALATFNDPVDLSDPDCCDAACLTLIGALPSIVSAFDRLRRGLEPVAPASGLSTAQSFLTGLRGESAGDLAARVLDVALILHADHTMNASTFAARVVASTEADPYAVCSAALGCLSGPLHGGANERVLAMLATIDSPEAADAWVESELGQKHKVMGFGHRVYKTKDPRAAALQGMAKDLVAGEGSSPVYDKALALEAAMLERVGARGIYPNVDFFSGIVYSRLGIPTDLFTPVFALARVAGYLAHWREQMQDNRIFRPRQVFTGTHGEPFPPIADR